MVIDTSAIVAMLSGEPEAAAFQAAVTRDPVRLLSAASLVECAIVIESRYGPAGGRELDLLLHAAQVDVVAVGREQADLARYAWRTYGRGKHPAGLNFGDCFAYALAKLSGESLLYKGDDFERTDLPSVAGGD